MTVGRWLPWVGSPDTSGSADGFHETARFNYPSDACSDDTTIWITDYNNGLRAVDVPTGEVTTLATVADFDTANTSGTTSKYPHAIGYFPDFGVAGSLVIGATDDHTINTELSSLYIWDLDSETLTFLYEESFTAAIHAIAPKQGDPNTALIGFLGDKFYTVALDTPDANFTAAGFFANDVSSGLGLWHMYGRYWWADSFDAGLGHVMESCEDDDFKELYTPERPNWNTRDTWVRWDANGEEAGSARHINPSYLYPTYVLTTNSVGTQQSPNAEDPPTSGFCAAYWELDPSGTPTLIECLPEFNDPANMDSDPCDYSFSEIHSNAGVAVEACGRVYFVAEAHHCVYVFVPWDHSSAWVG